MFFSNDRNQLRQVFFQAWQKATDNQTLEPMEQVIANVIEQHPEYHAFFSNPDNIEKDFPPEMGQTNPFLHMSMHISIHEQLTINQPAGIQDHYHNILTATGDIHETEHQIMDCLGEMIWKAQRENRPPSENDYIACLQEKSKK